MYRQYLKASLDINTLRSRNKYLPEGVKYCNGFCQDIRSQSEFSGTKMCCNVCRNLMSLGEKKIKDGKITLEQFKMNPSIVQGFDGEISTTKECKICKQTKSISEFETSRRKCKACRSIEALDRNDDIDNHIIDIEKLKENSNELETYVRHIPKDKLIKVISHFAIGRKSSDTKDRMVVNIVNHFKRLLNPLICMGGCGSVLQKEFTTCGACVEKAKNPSKVNRMVDFENNLETYVEGLKILTPEDGLKLTAKQLVLINNHLKAGVVSRKNKPELLEQINKVLKKREDEREERRKVEETEELKKNMKKEEVVKHEITLNGINVLAREKDGFINATLMCKAGGKLFADWKSLESTKELLQELMFEMTRNGKLITTPDIQIYPLIDIKKDEISKEEGSWIHPDLAVCLAQWISPKFAIQVSKWIRELAITGKVELGSEMTSEQLIEAHRQIKHLTEEKRAIQKKHQSFLTKKERYKHKRGPCFYIISNQENPDTRVFKVGIAEKSITERLSTHESTSPLTKLEYLVFTKDPKMIESVILSRFESKRKFLNREWLYDIELSDLIIGVKTFIDFADIDYAEEDLTTLMEANANYVNTL